MTKIISVDETVQREEVKASPRSLENRRLRARVGLPARRIGRKVVLNLRPREVIRRLEAAGFRLRRQTGSHARYVHPDNRKVTVPIHSRDIAVPTLRSILRQAHLSPEEWETL